MVSFFNSSSANVVQSLSQSVANNTNNIARLSASLQNVSSSFVITSASLLTKISQGKGSLADLDLLEELCDMVKHTSLCGLGQSAPNPVFSTLQYFRDEYLELVSS
jgi:NADH:ubiquinone oxidoreductase subunit F (NADH-binding)